MNPETISIIKDLAVIILSVTAAALCVALTVGLIRLFPYLRRSASNLDKTTAATAQISQDFAAVSEGVAQNLSKTTDNLEKTTAATAQISQDFAAISKQTSQNFAQSVENVAQATQDVGHFAGILGFIASLLDIRGLASQLDFGNIKNLRDFGRFLLDRTPDFSRIFSRWRSG